MMVCDVFQVAFLYQRSRECLLFLFIIHSTTRIAFPLCKFNHCHSPLTGVTEYRLQFDLCDMAFKSFHNLTPNSFPVYLPSHVTFSQRAVVLVLHGQTIYFQHLCVCLHCFLGKSLSLCLPLPDHACWDIFPPFTSRIASFLAWILNRFLTNWLEGASGKAVANATREVVYKPEDPMTLVLLLGSVLVLRRQKRRDRIESVKGSLGKWFGLLPHRRANRSFLSMPRYCWLYFP